MEQKRAKELGKILSAPRFELQDSMSSQESSSRRAGCSSFNLKYLSSTVLVLRGSKLEKNPKIVRF